MEFNVNEGLHEEEKKKKNVNEGLHVYWLGLHMCPN